MAGSNQRGGRIRIGTGRDGRIISLNLSLEGELFREGDNWISYCKGLDLSTGGRTEEEALKNTRDAITLFFRSCLSRGTLEQALTELGWEKFILPKMAPSPLNLPRDIIPAFMIDKQRGNRWSGHVGMQLP